jgi:hypothetical protein
VRDALYASAGTVGGSAHRWLLERPERLGVDASAKYVFGEALVWNAEVGRLQGASTLRLAGLAQIQTYAHLSLTYRFRIEKVRKKARILRYDPPSYLDVLLGDILQRRRIVRSKLSCNKQASWRRSSCVSLR